MVIDGAIAQMANSVRDNTARNRFELDVDGATAFADYRRSADLVIITHTETPRPLRGRGIATRLIEGAQRLIAADNRKMIAGCSFVADYLEKQSSRPEALRETR